MKNIAIDIGASSYRVMLSYTDGVTLRLREEFREKTPIYMEDGFLRWGLEEMGKNIVHAVKRIVGREAKIDSIGICSFGVDYVYLDEKGQLLDLPISYRDEKNRYYAEKALEVVSQEEIYRHTGIQFLPFNTLFQLYRDNQIGRTGKTFLMIGDFIAYLLTGNKANEITDLSTGALLEADGSGLSEYLLSKFGIDKPIFPEMKKPGETIGYLKDELMPNRDIDPISVIAVNSHDTSSAVSSLDLETDGEDAFLSCGTWALLGTKSSAYELGKKAMEANFTNSLMDDGICFLRNINGLYFSNRLFKAMREKDPSIMFPLGMDEFREGDYTGILLDIDDPLFHGAGDPEEALATYLIKTNQQRKNLTYRRFLSSFYVSLCLSVKDEFQRLQEVTGHKYKRLHLIGGASEAPIFARLLASALNAEVIIGAKEASATGNALIQISALTGESMDELRKKQRKTGTGKIYRPDETTIEWLNREYARFIRLKEERP